MNDLHGFIKETTLLLEKNKLTNLQNEVLIRNVLATIKNYYLDNQVVVSTKYKLHSEEFGFYYSITFEFKSKLKCKMLSDEFLNFLNEYPKLKDILKKLGIKKINITKPNIFEKLAWMVISI